MDQGTKDLVHRNSVFAWIALATGAILLIPLIAMQFTAEVNWDGIDFIVMASLLFSMASLFVLTARKIERRRRALIGGLFIATFLLIWAELAVGVFTGLGN